MPILDRQDAADVANAIQEILCAQEFDRSAAIRRMFVEILDFDPSAGSISLEGVAEGTELPSVAERIAFLDGFHVLHIGSNGNVHHSLRRAEVRSAARAIADQLGDDLLLAFTDSAGDRIQLVNPDLSGRRIVLRRLTAERGRPHRTAIQQIAGIYWSRSETGSARNAIERAFDVEPVTKRFFTEYRRVFEAAEALIGGFGREEKDLRRQFVQTLFNRLMFIYFLQHKGWLNFWGNEDYLNALLDDYKANPAQSNFYVDRLRPLYFAGLNNSNLTRKAVGKAANPDIGYVPFLNGGLFEEGPLDRREDVLVPDDAIVPILEELFNRFNFTVTESTPFDVEVAVDPEMLGKVFEELVTGRNETGSYYTPRHVVSYMCREALKGFLRGRDVGVSDVALDAFVDEHRTDLIDLAAARRLAESLREVKVIDPACGSGAYLLGMLQELVELQTTLYNAGIDARTMYELKLEIIERNLYGTDIDSFALNIAMLRMWLSLAIDYEDDQPIPLPNLDFKLVKGDSLLGASPDSLTLHRLAIDRSGIAQLKSEYLRSHDAAEKQSLRLRIDQVLAELGTSLGPEETRPGSIDWRIEFAEVFAEGGFDIAVANPPYRSLQKNRGQLADLYEGVGFETFKRSGDIYQLFYERGCDLLREAGGQLVYITSNSWLRNLYGKPLRRYFAKRHEPISWIDLGKDVFESATVDSGVLLLRVGGQARKFPAVDMDRVGIERFPPSKTHWSEIVPEKDLPWTILADAERSVFNKVRKHGTPLSEWGLSINRGIITGFNPAFIINDSRREELIAEDKRSANVIKPLLRGRHVRRWRGQWAGNWLIAAHNGYGSTQPIDVSSFPAVKNWLDRYFSQLSSRQDQGVTPYNLRSCSFQREFAGPKLFWADVTERGHFCISEQEMYCNDKAFMITGDNLKYLCAVLNSTLVWWLIKNTAPTTGMGQIEWKKYVVKSIPIPRPDPNKESLLVELVDQILVTMDQDAEADIGDLETAIDDLVYELYDLTENECTAIERALNLIHQTDEAEDAAILDSMLDRSEEDRELVNPEIVMDMLRSAGAG